MKNDSKVAATAQSKPQAAQTKSAQKRMNQKTRQLRKEVKALPKAMPADMRQYLTDPASLLRMQEEWEKKPLVTVGIDLGDVKSNVCVLNRAGDQVGEYEVDTTPESFEKFFSGLPKASRIALEVGTHSPWVSRLLREQGHDVIVVNARRLPKQRIKTDRRDARMLARKAYQEVAELGQVRHRGEQEQKDMLVIQTRASLVETRTKFINTARGLVKGFGCRLEAMDTDNVTAEMAAHLPEDVAVPIRALLRMVESVNLELELLDDQIKKLIEQYPITKEMMKIRSVGPVTALTFVLTISDPERFDSSRTVGVALGMTPNKAQSGQLDPQLGISKAGNGYLRGLLVQCAQLTLSKRGGDSDIRRWGLKLMGDGTDGHQKKRAVVAVARKLAVLLHTLWSSGRAYDPFYHSRREEEKQRARAKAA
jgi:transposase